MLDDELKKLGLRLRHRVPAKARGEDPGQISFDDRGNAIYEWIDARLEEDGEEGERARLRALEHPGLTMVEDEPSPHDPIRRNPKGLRLGYNPYESGLLDPKQRTRKKDLRALSRWVELRRKLSSSSEEQ